MSSFSDDNFYDENFFNGGMLKLFAEKPLFRILMIVVMRHIFPLCYLIVMTYFFLVNFFYNRRRRLLVVLLDALSSLAPPLNRQRFELFLGGVLFHIAVYSFTIYPMVKMVVPNLKVSVKVVVLFFLFFTLNVNSNISFILTNYYKFAIKIALNQIMADFQASTNKTDLSGSLRRLVASLSRLSVINRQLNNVLSLPLLFNMLPYIAQIVATFSTVGVQNDHLPNASYLVQFGIPIAFICHNERCIQRQLTTLDRLVAESWRNDDDAAALCLAQQQKNSQRFFSQKFTISKRTPLAVYKGNGNSDRRRLSLQCLELVDVYRNYYKLKVFNLCTISWTFFVYVILFVVNYAVLITQTTST